MSDPNYGDADFSFADPSASATDREWKRVLDACARELPIGFGLLDSFLSGPDLERRIELIVNSASASDTLRLELADTMTVDQSRNLTEVQIARLIHATGR